MKYASPMLETLMVHGAHKGMGSVVKGDLRVKTTSILTSLIGTWFDPRNMYFELKEACYATELRDWHPHERRHSVANFIQTHVVKLRVVGEVLEHVSTQMTAQVCGHILDLDRQAVSAAFAGVPCEDLQRLDCRQGKR